MPSDKVNESMTHTQQINQEHDVSNTMSIVTSAQITQVISPATVMTPWTVNSDKFSSLLFINVDQLKLVKETIVPLGDYFFISQQKVLVKRFKTGKIDASLSKISAIMAWQPTGRPKEKEIETTSDLGAFAIANEWFVNKLSNALYKC